jgi:hypothetical protein
MRSLSTPGLTLMGPALLITTMFCHLTLPPSLFTSISATALRTALGPITIKSGVHTLLIDPWLGQNGPLVVQYGRIFNLFITPAPSSCSQIQSLRCSRDNWRLKALILGFLSTFILTKSIISLLRSVFYHASLLILLPYHLMFWTCSLSLIKLTEV